jgi:5-methylcytosine-specific restriction protein B
MAHLPGTHATSIYAAAARWSAQALRADVGVISDRPVWTPEVLAGLHRRLATQVPIRGDTFDDQWDRTIEGADDPQLQLAAELLWLHLLFPSDVGSARKRRYVTDTLALMVEPVGVPDELDAVLSRGLARSGIAYKARRLSQLQLVVEAALELKRRSRRERTRLLADPWAVKAWLAGVTTPAAQSQREVLLHMLHPATFEPIATNSLKHRIIAAFPEHVTGGVSDVDRALLLIRAGLETEHGRGFVFTDAAIEARWRSPEPEP